MMNSSAAQATFPCFLHRLASRSVLVAALCFGWSNCAKHPVPDDWLAQVDHRYITVNEFVSRAELSPPPGLRQVNGFSGKRAWRLLLIGEKLLANEAQALRLHKSAEFEHWRRYTEGVAVVKELYRDEVKSKIEVRESEIDSAMVLARTSLLIKFFKTDTRAAAEKFIALVPSSRSFDQAIHDYFGEAIPEKNYTSQFTFGDADENLEKAVFALQVGGTTPVIETAMGFFVVSLVQAESNVSFSQTDHLKQRAAIKRILRARKADKLSAEYVRHLMADKNVVLKGKPFSALTKCIEQRLDFARPALMPKMLPLAETDYRQAEIELSNYLDEPLIVFKNGRWTIREALEKFRLRNLPFNRESPAAMRHTLEKDLQAIVRDEFLAQEGYRRNLHKRTTVQEEMRMWVDHHLYTLMVDRLNLRPQSGDDVHFPPEVSELVKKYRVVVAEEKLQEIELTGIKMIAVHPGRPHQLALPLWPRF